MAKKSSNVKTTISLRDVARELLRNIEGTLDASVEDEHIDTGEVVTMLGRARIDLAEALKDGQSFPQIEARVMPHRDLSGHPTLLLAFAQIVIADAFVIKGIRILVRRDGSAEDQQPFVVWPAEKGKGPASDRWYDIAHPTSAVARAEAIRLILEKWEEVKDSLDK